HPDLGRRPLGAELRRHPLLHEGHRPPGPHLGRRPGRDQEHVRQARHPRGRAQVPGRRRRPVRVRGGLPQPPRGPPAEGGHLHRHRHGRPRLPRPRPRIPRHDHPDRRQQVRGPQLGGLERRLVRLHPRRREGRHPAPGLLPHQRREHGPVRADPDHRRGGRPGALRRGLHRPDVLLREPPLGRGRDRRQEGRPLPLHDDPELGQQHLQPRHQAGRGPRRRAHGVGRRQPRQQADDEVPGRLHGRPGRPRRDPLDRLRRQGPAPGRRRQGRPRRPPHQLADHLQEHQQERRPGQLPRPPEGHRRCQGLEVERRLRRAHPRPRQPVRHLPLHRDRRGRRQDRPRGQRLQDRRGAALLPAEPRALRGRGLHADRQRLHRAPRQGA
ncbi:hypothetical protein HK102_012444, partial [Quaeritorhiza haematococci]